LEPLRRLESEALRHHPPDHGVDLGLVVLEREVAMARGMRAAKPRDLPAQAHIAPCPLERALDGAAELRDGKLRQITAPGIALLPQQRAPGGPHGGVLAVRRGIPLDVVGSVQIFIPTRLPRLDHIALPALLAPASMIHEDAAARPLANASSRGFAGLNP